MDLFQVLRTPNLTKHYPKKESMKIEGKSILLVSEKNKPPFVFLTLFSATRGYPRLYNYPPKMQSFRRKVLQKSHIRHTQKRNNKRYQTSEYQKIARNHPIHKYRYTNIRLINEPSRSSSSSYSILKSSFEGTLLVCCIIFLKLVKNQARQTTARHVCFVTFKKVKLLRYRFVIGLRSVVS